MNVLRGLIAGGVRNPVLVNLAMLCIIVGGVASARSMVREAFPEFRIDYIAVTVSYPGASAEDVERGICAPIEDAVRGVEGSREVMSLAAENVGSIWIALMHNVRDTRKVLDDIKERVGQVTTLPPEAEQPIIKELILRQDVISVAVYGDVDERTLKRYAREIRNDLLSEKQISQVQLTGTRNDEIVIEVSEAALLKYDLTIAQILGVVKRSSLDLPAGVIRTAEEEITLRVTGQSYTAADYEDLVVIESEDAIVRLGDIAVVRETFEEEVRRGRFNGSPAALVSVFKTPSEDSAAIATLVRDYVRDRQAWLPERLQMSVWGDTSLVIDSMLAMLIKNGLMGIVLVFLTLLVFLELRHALWVAVGIPVAFCGALIIMNFNGETINLISMFALLMVSGIIVDDAIVIAESIHARRRAGDDPELASEAGAALVALPVLGASVTTIISFIPLLFVVGVMGKFIRVLPVIVIASVVASAIEAFLILPSHLCKRTQRGVAYRPHEPSRVRRAMERSINHVITQWYRPIQRLALQYRAVTVGISISAVLVVVGLIYGGRLPLILLPKDDANILYCRVRMPEGTPSTTTERVGLQIEQAAYALNADPDLRPSHDGDLVRQVFRVTGEFSGFVGFVPMQGGNLCEVRIELMPAEQRRVDAGRIIQRWRDHIGDMPHGTEVSVLRQQLGPTEHPIEIRLLGGSIDDLAEASELVQAKLREFAGVRQVKSDLIPGKRELRVKLRPAARALGLTLDDVAVHLRHGFFGGEVETLQRGQEQVKVRVRYPISERRSIADLENERIPTAKGDDVPFHEVADVEWAQGYANIWHQDGRLRVVVSAALEDDRTSADPIFNELESGFLNELVGQYNDMTWTYGGDQERLDESLASLWDGFSLAVFAIYAVLASMLRSYVQPLVIVIALPFGVVGVVVGHLLLGLNLTLMSMFGIVALSGVVVNDSLVLVDAINRALAAGVGVLDAVRAAGEARFRAVTLTSITTVAGLLPLLLERSSQANSVMPMAVALAFGIMFATALTLFLVPASFLLINDMRRFLFWLRYGGAYPAPEVVEEAAPDVVPALSAEGASEAR